MKKSGFTLMEMLIVITIVAILVTIAIAAFSNSLHKAKVAADLANIRGYYAELQVDYLETGEYLDESLVPYWGEVQYDFVTINFPKSGAQVKLQAGAYSVDKVTGGGYSVAYNCKDNHTEHNTVLE